MKALQIISKAAGERTIPLQGGRYDIGRGEEAAIQIDSRKVSRKHAELVVEENLVHLLDCGSANGTLVNGQQVSSIELQHGDRISIGEVVLQYHSNEPISVTPDRQKIRHRFQGLGLTMPRGSLRNYLLISMVLIFGIVALLGAWHFKGYSKTNWNARLWEEPTNSFGILLKKTVRI